MKKRIYVYLYGRAFLSCDSFDKCERCDKNGLLTYYDDPYCIGDKSPEEMYCDCDWAEEAERLSNGGMGEPEQFVCE